MRAYAPLTSCQPGSMQQPPMILALSAVLPQLTVYGLAEDNTRLTVQVKQPDSAVFAGAGSTSADYWGYWSFTITLPQTPGDFAIRAVSPGGVSSAVAYSNGTPLRAAILQQGRAGYSGALDTSIDAWTPLTNFGLAGVTGVRSGNVRRSLHRFDLSGLREGAPVLHAGLALYSHDRSNCAAISVASYMENQAWDAAAATWISATTTLAWALPGADPTPAGDTQDPSDIVLVNQVERWYRWDVTDMVQSWISGRTQNDGILLRWNSAPGSASVLYRFAATEYWSTPRHPYLFLTLVDQAPLRAK